MEQEVVITLLQKMFILVLQLTTPVLVIGLLVGLAVSIFQTVTQIQESTLTIVPKIIVGVLTLIALMPWMLNIIITNVQEFFDMIPGLIS